MQNKAVIRDPISRNAAANSNSLAVENEVKPKRLKLPKNADGSGLPPSTELINTTSVAR